MLFFHLPSILSVDPLLGRLDYESLSQQALMEMVVSHLSDENQQEFKDENGNFLDIAEWTNVETDHDWSVTSIEWSYVPDEGIAKPESQGSIGLEWLPQSVELFDITSRGYEGTFDSAKLPLELRQFYGGNSRLIGSLQFADLPENIECIGLYANFLTGTLDLRVMPQRLQLINIYNNQFSGCVRTSKNTDAVKELYLGMNQLKGMDWANLPQRLEKFNCDENSMPGPAELTELPQTLKDVRLDNMGLSGEVSWEKLPRGLQRLDLFSNQLSGTMCFKKVPREMKALYLRMNRFSGEIDLGDLPSSMQSVSLENNELSGTIDLSNLPDTLLELYLHCNKLRGDISLENLPNGFRGLALDQNRFDGVLTIGKLPMSLLYLKLDANPLRKGVRFVGLEEGNIPKEKREKWWGFLSE